MELREIEKQAKALMTAHGVGSLDFAFDNAKRRIGATHVRTIGNTALAEKITLSRHYAVLLQPEEIHEVILHEIAHALTPGHGHNDVWRRAARQLGIKGDRCMVPSAAPEKRITAFCPECGDQLAAQHRLPTAVYVCRYHRNRALVWHRDGQRVPLESMPAGYRQKVARAMAQGKLR